MKKHTRLWMLVAMLTSGLMVACNGGTSTKAPTSKKTHDPITLQVTGTNKYEPHNFVDGKCTMCDETTDFIQDPLNKANPTYLTEACEEQGKVEAITYTYHKKDGTTMDKTAYVYTPYGYNAEDKNTKYDVMYMLHGKGLNEGYWFAQGTYKSTDGIYTGGFGTQNMIDRLMKEGKAKKAIYVTPTYYMDAQETQDEGNFGEELTKDLMPYIAEHYNTFALDSTEASLKANRDHQAYVGLSLGSMYSYQIILADYVDYFSYVGSFSGSSVGEESWNAIADGLSTGKFKDTKLKYWYAGVGSLEDENTYPGDPFNAFRIIVSKVDYLKQGENCMFMLTNKTGHNYATWITCLYNCIQKFFKA